MSEQYEPTNQDKRGQYAKDKGISYIEALSTPRPYTDEHEKVEPVNTKQFFLEAQSKIHEMQADENEETPTKLRLKKELEETVGAYKSELKYPSGNEKQIPSMLAKIERIKSELNLDATEITKVNAELGIDTPEKSETISFKDWMKANPMFSIARTKLNTFMGSVMSGANAAAFKEKMYSYAADRKAENKRLVPVAAQALGALGLVTAGLAMWKVTGAAGSEITDSLTTGATSRIEATASLADGTGGASYDPTAETGGASYDPTAATGETGQTGGTGSTGTTESTGGASAPSNLDPLSAVLGTDPSDKKSGIDYSSNYSDENHRDHKVNAWGTERGIEDADFGTFKGETLDSYLATHSNITAGNVEVLVNARFQEKYGVEASTFNSAWGQNERENMKREYTTDSGHSLSKAGERAHELHMQELSEGKVVKMTADEAASKYGLTVNSYMTEGDLKGGIDDIATATGGVVGTVLVTLDENGKPKFAEKAACGNNVFIGSPDAPTPEGGTPTPGTPDDDIRLGLDGKFKPNEWDELTPKDPTKDSNTNDSLNEQEKMGDVRVPAGEKKPATEPTDTYTPPAAPEPPKVPTTETPPAAEAPAQPQDQPATGPSGPSK